MTDRGEAYIRMEKNVEAYPQKKFLCFSRRAKLETNATTENTTRTKMRRARVLRFSFLGAKMRKMIT